MTHPEWDQDLLMFAHGALPPLKAMLTRLHLARCPDCRQRLDQFQAASHGLAGAIRGPQLPHWSFPAAGAVLGVATAWMLAVVVLLVVLLGTLVVRQHQRIPSGGPVPAGSIPCRPDLPNDHCH